MSDRFYRFARWLGAPVFRIIGSPTVIGVERVPVSGPCVVAATHQSPYDVPLLIHHTGRLLDFVSIVEVFRNPLVGWLYGSLNAFPLDRSRADAKTVRIIVQRLRAGRVIAMFPEGGFRKGMESVVHTRRIRPGIGRIAQMTGAAVVPCVVIGSEVFGRPGSWLPLRRTRYGVIFGEPIDPGLDAGVIEERLIEAFVALHAELSRAMAVQGAAADDPGSAR